MTKKNKLKKLLLLASFLPIPTILLAACSTQTNPPNIIIPGGGTTPPNSNEPLGVFPEPSDESEPSPETNLNPGTGDTNGKVPPASTYQKDVPSNSGWRLPFPRTPWLRPQNPEKPNAPLEPANPVDPPEKYQKPVEPRGGVSEFTYHINKEILKELIQSNQHGYSPKSLVLALSSKQNAQSETDWLRKFLNADEKSIVEWRDLTFFEFNANEEDGTLEASFKVGTQKLSFSLGKEDGLLKSSDYYDKIKSLTLSLDVAYESIALAATGTNPDRTALASENANGIVLKNNKYKTGARYSGTGWVMDRIENANDETSDTLSYIIGTNIHVGSYAGAFIENINKTDVALDPLNIQFAWKRNISNSHSGFDKTKANNERRNEITNLRFGSNDLFNDDFNNRAVRAIETNRFDRIRSYYKPTATMLQQKRQMMNSLIYSPKHKTTATVGGRDINYESLGADFMAIRMNFKKADLQAQWPELFNAFRNKTENQLFAKINTTKKLDKDEEFYTGGYPGYGSGGEDWEKRIYREEGYNYQKYGRGEYWKASTLSKFRFPSLVKPQFDHEEGLDPKSFDSITGSSGIRNLPKVTNEEVLHYIDHYDEQDFRKMWGKNVNVAETFAGNDISDEAIRRTAQYQISQRELTPSLRPMLRKIYSTSKRHLMGSSQYIKGGASGSMILNARNEIVGILSAVVPGYVGNGWKNAIFYDFYNTYSKMSGNKVYGLDIIEKLREANINTVVMNPKNKR